MAVNSDEIKSSIEYEEKIKELTRIITEKDKLIKNNNLEINKLKKQVTEEHQTRVENAQRVRNLSNKIKKMDDYIIENKILKEKVRKCESKEHLYSQEIHLLKSRLKNRNK